MIYFVVIDKTLELKLTRGRVSSNTKESETKKKKPIIEKKLNPNRRTFLPLKDT